MVPVCNCLTSFFAGFVIFGIIGFMAHEMNIGVGEVATGGQSVSQSVSQLVSQSVS